MDSTNVTRLLQLAKIDFVLKEYDEEITDGELVAKALGEDPSSVFKTLVTIGNDLNHYVFIVPVNCKLDLRKAAKSVNVKNVEMIKQKDLFPLTGYVHGGCSPIGMKKQFKTVIDETAILYDYIHLSAGKKGRQIKINPSDLISYINGIYFDLV